MSDLAMFKTDRLGNFFKFGQVTWPGVALKDLAHIEEDRFFAFDTSDGAFVQARLYEARYRSGFVDLGRQLWTGGVTDVAYGVLFDRKEPVIGFKLSGFSNWIYKLARGNGSTITASFLGFQPAGSCHNSLQEYHGSSIAALQVLKRNPFASLGTKTLPATASSVCFNGQHLWMVDGTSSVRQLDMNGTLIKTYTERTGFNPTSITFNGQYFFCGNG